MTDLERRYPGFQLGPLSFHLPPGRALGLLGANGAGKTTLLAGLAGQARLQGGSVVWNGSRIVRGEWRYKYHVSYVRDVPALYAELTVGQTLAFVRRLQPTWRADRAADLLELFRLAPGQRVRALSRGMRAKLALLVAVCHDVRLLLLDEVTAGIDADTRDEIQRFLRRLVMEGVSVLVSSHIFEDIEQVSDEVLILRQGAPVFHGAVSGVRHLTVAVLPSGAAASLGRSASIAGRWTIGGDTALLLNEPIDPTVEAALRASGAMRRAATVRDVYFACRERS